MGWFKGILFKFRTFDKRLLLEGGGCASTVPTRGGIYLIQGDSIPTSGATFPCAPFLSSQKQLWDFSGWDESFVFSKHHRKLAGIALSRENKSLVSPGSVQIKAPEVTATHTASLGKEFFCREEPSHSNRATRVPKYRCPQTHSEGSLQLPHTPGWLPLPNQFLLHGHNKVFLKFIDVWFDQLLGKWVGRQISTLGQKNLGPECPWVCSMELSLLQNFSSQSDDPRMTLIQSSCCSSEFGLLRVLRH